MPIFLNTFSHFLKKFIIHPQLWMIENSYDEHVSIIVDDMEALMMS